MTTVLTMSFHRDGDGKLWPDLEGRASRMANPRKPVRVAVLDGGMESGRPSVMICMELGDGSTVVAQTSAVQMATFGRALLVKYPKLLD